MLVSTVKQLRGQLQQQQPHLMAPDSAGASPAHEFFEELFKESDKVSDIDETFDNDSGKHNLDFTKPAAEQDPENHERSQNLASDGC